MQENDIPFLTVAELSRLIKGKEVSAVEATRVYLDRIDDQDFKFNSYLTVCRQEALDAARCAEEAILSGSYLGPMHGIPIAVKDQFLTKGIRTTGGSRLLADFIPTDDATIVARLKQAGAVILGKLNLAEFAITGFSHSFSYPRNPWDLDMSAGGSSSGCGAATAASLCATSVGEDTGGSIRRPAAWCNLVGVVPSWGRVSRYGTMRGTWSMDTPGPVSRTVEDAAITLGAIAGHDPKDRHTWPTPVPDYRQALDGNVRGLRIGVVTERMEGEHVEPQIANLVAEAVAVLGAQGASVESLSLPLIRHEGVLSAILLAVEPALDHREWIRDRIGEYGHDVRVSLLTGSILSAQTYDKAQRVRSLLRGQVMDALRRFDVLALPTLGRDAQRIMEDPPITSKADVGRLPYLFTRAFSLAGCPAVSVPCGFSPRGLPVGLQLVGSLGGDETLLKAAHAYEQDTPWHRMRAPG